MHLLWRLFNITSFIYYLFLSVFLPFIPSGGVGALSNSSKFFDYESNRTNSCEFNYENSLISDNLTNFITYNEFNKSFEETKVFVNDTIDCKQITCIRKCCGYGEVIKDLGSDGSKCMADEHEILPQFYLIKNWTKRNEQIENVTGVNFGIKPNLDCDKFLLEPEFNPGDEYFLNADTGHLHVRDFTDPILHDKYCLDHVDYGDGIIKLEAFICFGDNEEEVAIDTHAVAIAISSIFFTLTLLTYACLPKMQNMHGKILMGNVSGFLLAYLIVTVNRFQHSWHEQLYCQVSAYLIYFGIMSGFLWLNVMCFDIWGTFR